MIPSTQARGSARATGNRLLRRGHPAAGSLATTVAAGVLLGAAPPAAAQEATDPERINVLEGFKVERLYSVPRERQGSWVAICIDDKGRFIVSDQYGSLYRFAPPAAGAVLREEEVEKIDLDIGHSQGLLHAFGSLYLTVNDKAHGGRGLYRVRDTDGDDRYDEVKRLKKFEEQGGEHGPHAVVLGPEGKSLFVIVGNQTALPEHDWSRVPPVWGEDLLLPRIYGRGFMKGVEAPRGWVARTDPEGERWEIVATGFRNQYDAAFNRAGDLFTYDADMEWDVNTPWYRPTRICHVVSGGEFGWRNGSGKWPAYYSDSVPAVVDIGPGSPVGVAFGYGAAFPEKYQEAFYALDWSYGKLYAVHLRPEGGSYAADFEEFISAQPLPLTDIVVHPGDRAMYFTTGGRRVQSGLFRVTYDAGGDPPPVVSAAAPAALTEAQERRRSLEVYHGRKDPRALDAIFEGLADGDRAVRYAARVALEHQPVRSWRARVFAAESPRAKLAGLIALARVGAPGDGGAAKAARGGLQKRVISALAEFDYAALDRPDRLDLLRAYGLAFIRLGEPSQSQARRVARQLDAHFPAPSVEENVELSQVLVYLQHAPAARKTVELLERAPSQEEQIAYAKNLRLLEAGWDAGLEERYFRWMGRAKSYRGGASFGKFLGSIRDDALKRLPAARRAAMEKIVSDAPAADAPQFAFSPRSFVQAWTVADLEGGLEPALKGGRDFKNGRELFGAAACFACHRFNQQGGSIGPDLTSAAGKFSPRDLLESIIEPSREISDQYGSVVVTKEDGSTVVGRVVNLNGDRVMINTNMLAPGALTNVNQKDVVSIEPSKVSMMPPGLLNTLSASDVHDLLAYLLAAGDPEHAVFQ